MEGEGDGDCAHDPTESPTRVVTLLPPVVTLVVTPKSHKRYTVLPGNPAESPLCNAVTLRIENFIYTRIHRCVGSSLRARATLFRNQALQRYKRQNQGRFAWYIRVSGCSNACSGLSVTSRLRSLHLLPLTSLRHTPPGVGSETTPASADGSPRYGGSHRDPQPGAGGQSVP